MKNFSVNKICITNGFTDKKIFRLIKNLLLMEKFAGIKI